MKMRMVGALLLAAVLAAGMAGCGCKSASEPMWRGEVSAQQEILDEVVIQVATIGGLKRGAYEGVVSTQELGQYADHGLGAYDNLDGEMLLVDGVFYRVDVSGAVEAGRQGMLPYATATRFAPDFSFTLDTIESYADLQQRITEKLPLPAMMYALRVSGNFATVKARSVPGQTQPYPPLAEVIAKQSVFHFQDIPGAAVGFWRPNLAPEIWPGGFHLHFINDDRDKGGHLLDLSAQSLQVQVDVTPLFSLTLPSNADFQAKAAAGKEAGEHSY